MKYAISTLLATILLLVSTEQAHAQKNYNTSIGGRLGPSYGFSLKHFFAERVAFEGLVTSRYFGPYRRGPVPRGYAYGHWNTTPGVNLTALFEWHFPIGRVRGFNWFIGGGGHVGVWGGYVDHPYFDDDTRPYVLTGLDFVAGVEYTFEKIPLTLQADIKPSFHFFEYLGVWYDEAAITARYAF
ncbi:MULTISPECIES: hypothetical protein [unclassified Aureispira]|uniref:hypothetical protein n=1 Tax=unclassified Aureispira TaxID=2649989 RepID=UPI000695BAB4|nr:MULTISPECIES: hypothetical protein [unclassified Aureispira]WMX15577.1 hypothetical protein QP953_04190 [Aureispira sp. CCB-E]